MTNRHAAYLVTLAEPEGRPCPRLAVGDWVKAARGCIWRESRPDGFTINPDEPRACTTHRADHPASVRPSPQGMAMVPVTYHDRRPE